MRALRRSSSSPRLRLASDPEWVNAPFESLESLHFEGCDVLVHLAAHSANVPYDSLEACLHWNVTVPLRMAARARKAGIARFLVAGTCFEYGHVANREAFIDASAQLEPIGTYPTSKAAASIAWLGFARTENVVVRLARIFQVYGPCEPSGRLWPTLIEAAKSAATVRLSPGEQVRDFIHVSEVAKMLLAEAEKTQHGESGVVHIATGKPVSIREFAEEIMRQEGGQGRLEFGAIPYRANEMMRIVAKMKRD